MSVEIYLRPLKEDDARVSWRWRRNPSIWKYTGSDPSKYGVTELAESNWIRQAITDEKSVRFAICRKDSDQFIGIVDLREIDFVSSSAEFNIFIGEESCWGQGIGSQATREALIYAKDKLSLKRIVLRVAEENVAATKMYLKCGFRFLDERIQKRIPMRKMEVLLDKQEQQGRRY